ncbi:MAG: phosphoribosylglycinamide synthetase C domain-containing protein, partial [Micrococcales bacterium]
ILVEEFLDGEEVSLFFLSDGKTVLPLCPAQDFKRAYDNDEGPNTGGMGAYSPLPWLPEGFIEEVERTVAQPTVNELARLGEPFVGLLYCGLIVTSDRDAALAHAQKFIDMGILVEEFLDGEEVSLFFLSDGKTVLPLSPAQDFKRAFDNDEGPNTGGMGAYSPLPWLPDNFIEEVERTVAQPTVDELARLGAPFVGLLYCGLIITKRGVRVIEFNARFGDPETQVVLRRLTNPLESLLHRAATGCLADGPSAKFSDDVAITVVLASEGYPDTAAPDREITGLQEDADVEHCHAATKLIDGKLYATGGRVLSVVASAKDFHTARELAYANIKHIKLEGSHYRKDIAKKVAN